MRESKETYIKSKHIGRMFNQGKEIKELWFRGDLIFKLQDEFEREMIMRNLPDNVFGDTAIRCGKYVCLYYSGTQYGAFKIHRFLNGEYVDTVSVAGESGSMLNAYPYYTQGFIAIAERNNSGWVAFHTFNGKDQPRRLVFSDEFKQYVMAAGVSPQIGLYCQNRIFIGNLHWNDRKDSTSFPQMTDEEIAHYKNFSITIVLNSDNEVVTEDIQTVYGLDMGVEIENDKVYTLKNPLIQKIMRNPVTGIYYATLITKFELRTNGTRRDRYITYGSYMCIFDGISAIAGAQIVEPVTAYISSTSSTTGTVIQEQRKVGVYEANAYGLSTRSHNGENYPYVPRDYSLLIQQELSGEEYTDISFNNIWVPGQCVGYDSVAKKYIVVSSKDGKDGIKTIPGALQSEVIDDSQHYYYDMNIDWDVFSESFISDYIGNVTQGRTDSNDDGMYMFDETKFFYINFQQEVENEL